MMILVSSVWLSVVWYEDGKPTYSGKGIRKKEILKTAPNAKILLAFWGEEALASDQVY